MYDQITILGMDFYTGDTGVYLGRARFLPSKESEDKLLDLLNYGKVPNNLFFMNMVIYRRELTYITPALFNPYYHYSIMYLLARDKDSREQVSFEIRLEYNFRVRAHYTPNPYYFESLQLENITVFDIRVIAR